MARSDREHLMATYFDALDDEDVNLARDIFDDSFIYESSAGKLSGFAGFRKYAEELRTTSNSTHTVINQVHADTISVAEGVVTGFDLDGEEKTGNFCDVFEFTAGDGAIARITVYLNRSISD